MDLPDPGGHRRKSGEGMCEIGPISITKNLRKQKLILNQWVECSASTGLERAVQPLQGDVRTVMCRQGDIDNVSARVGAEAGH